MTNLSLHTSDTSALNQSEDRVFGIGRWTVHEHQTVTSTNLIAARLPAWHAVRADRQTAGRGRFQRSWVSDQGGLWLSAVVPLTPKSPLAQILPLAAGLSVCDALRSLGVSSVRMRWPNDILVGRRKLAGLLLDQIVPGLGVIGIGINVSNRPQEHDPALEGQVARLFELISPPPSLNDLAGQILENIEGVWNQVEREGSPSVLPRINVLWQTSIRVQVDLDGELWVGRFEGVDAGGRLLFKTDRDERRVFEPHEVRLLREID